MKTNLIRAIVSAAVITVVVSMVVDRNFNAAFGWALAGITYYFLVKTETEFEEYRKSHEKPNTEQEPLTTKTIATK